MSEISWYHHFHMLCIYVWVHVFGFEKNITIIRALPLLKKDDLLSIEIYKKKFMNLGRDLKIFVR